MNFPALASTVPCAQAPCLKDLDAFVDAQPRHALDEAEEFALEPWAAVQGAVPGGPPCSWKGLCTLPCARNDSHMQRQQLRTLYSMLRQLDASSDPDNPLQSLYRAQLLRKIEALRTQDPPLPAVVRLT